MTDTTQGAPAPKKRSLFKRAAWQDKPKAENEDIFSHSNEFTNIVAEQTRLQAEKRQQRLKEKQASQADRKRRKVSNDHDEPKQDASALSGSGPSGSGRASRTSTKARSVTPLSPVPSVPPPDSLSSRYDTLAKAAFSKPPSDTKPLVIDLGDSDSDGADPIDYPKHTTAHAQSTRHTALDDDDELEEVSDPRLAALAARARERAANKARAAASPSGDGEPSKAPVVDVFIDPMIPDAKPLRVKVRTDSTLERTKSAWCAKEGYSPEMTRAVFFTWKGTRLYDSTTVKRLGIQIDEHGNVSVEGDSNIYDETNIPKVIVEAWTDTLFQQHKREEAEAATAKRKAAEPPPVIEERTPTPEPAPTVQKIRLKMKAKGMDEYKISVNPDTTFGHIASAYKTARKIDASQPITLMFDGERLAPLDTVADTDIEDMDSIDVLLR